VNRAVHKISLDIHRQGTQVNLEVKKGDTARRLVVGFVEDGAPYVVDAGCYGVFMAKKPDGNTLFNACTIENGQIVYDFTEQTVSAAGRMLCEVQLYGSDALLITSPRIAMIVSGSLLDEGVVSESESTVLGEILEELESIQDEMDELGNVEVTVSGNAADGFTADLEFDEIRQAHDAGQACVCLWDSWRLPLVSMADEVARFSAVVDGICYQVEIGQDGVTAGDAVLDNRTRIVTMQGSEEEGYTTDFTLNAILMAHNQGPVVCLCDGIYLPLVVLDGGRAEFFGWALSSNNYIWVSFTNAGSKVIHGSTDSGSDSGSGGSSGGTESGGDRYNIVLHEHNGGYVSTASYTEIVTAFNAGREMWCVIPLEQGQAQLPLVKTDSDGADPVLYFAGAAAWDGTEDVRAITARICIQTDGLVVDVRFDSLAGNGNLVVGMTYFNGNYTPDVTYEGVLTVHRAAVRPVQCRIDYSGVEYILPLCGIQGGALIYGGSASIASIAVLQNPDDSISVFSASLATEDYVDEMIASSGGSSAAAEMELIASGINTEPVRRLKITADSEGNAFELTKATFIVKNVKDSGDGTGNMNCHVKLGFEMGNPVQMYTGTTNRDIVAHTDAVSGVMLVAQGKGSFYTYGAPMMATNYIPNQSITDAMIETADATKAIAAGATYELWGIRK